MKPQDASFDKIAGLIESLAAGTLSQADDARLEEIVAKDLAARRYYLERVFLIGQLKHRHARRETVTTWRDPVGSSAVISAVKPAQTFFKQLVSWLPGGEFTVGFLVMVVVAAAFWGLATFTLRGSRNSVAPQLATNKEPVSKGFLAKLIGVQDCRWMKAGQELGSNELAIGANFNSGEEIELTDGCAELEYVNGTRMLIEAPARLTLATLQRSILARGRVVAYVPRQAVGFTIETPAAVVVDLGTEFGVEVTEQQTAQVTVFEGAVRLEQVDSGHSNAAAAPSVTLRAGESRNIVAKPTQREWTVEKPSAKTEFVRGLKQAPRPYGTVLPREQIAIDDSGPQFLMNAAASHFKPVSDDLLQTSLDPRKPVWPAINTAGRFDGQRLAHLYNGRLYDTDVDKRIEYYRRLYGPAIENCTQVTEDSFSGSDGLSVEFYFDMSKSPKGFDILRIESISGWLGSRAGQHYLVFVRLHGRGDFETRPLVEVDALAARDERCERRISVTGKEGVALATGANAIRFVLLSVESSASESVYREFDVIGGPTLVAPRP